MTKTWSFELDVVFVKVDAGTWFAQGLQWDVAAQGDSIAQARRRFERTFRAQVVTDIRDGKAPLEGIGRAPEKYWDLFRRGERLETQNAAIPFAPPFLIDAVARELRVA